MNIPVDFTPAEELRPANAKMLLIVTIIFATSSTVSLILRMFATRMNKTSLGPEDWTIIIAQILLYGLAVAVILEIFLGSVGHHAHELPFPHVVKLLKLLVANRVLYASTTGFIKTSICLFYLKMFSARRSFRIATWGLIGFIAVWTLLAALAAFALCKPLAAGWDPTLPGGTCAQKKITFLVIGNLDLALDIAVFAFPMPIIWRLQMPARKRVGLFVMFGLGISTIVICILRVHSFAVIDDQDYSFKAPYVFMWSFVEPALGITVASGPLLGALLKKSRFAKCFTTNTSSEYSESDFNRLDQVVLTDFPSNSTKMPAEFGFSGSETDIPMMGITVGKEGEMDKV